MNTPSERAGWSREALDAFERLKFASRDDVFHRLYGMNEEITVRRSDVRAIMAIAPPSSLDGGARTSERASILERGIAEIMAGLVSGKISGEDIVWVSEIETLWERCHAILDPEHSCELPQTDNAAAILAALAAAPLPVGKQGVMADRCTGTDTEATTSPSSAGSVAGQWRTMDSAPKDGRSVGLWIVHSGNGYTDPFETFDVGFWDQGRWEKQWTGEPTHWMPMPDQPSPAGGVKLPPSDPTGSEDSQDAAPAGPTVGANTPSPPLADGEPEKEDFGADLSQPHRLSGSHTTDQRST